MTYTAKLERNLLFYYPFQVFTKRAYLPLMVVYALSIAKLSLPQLGVILAIASIVLLVFEVPSGYLSDKMGHKRALILGTGIMALSPLGYVFLPSFWGVLMEAAGYTAGFAFLSGTREAFLHETLMELGREGEYARLMGKFQTAGLLGNVVLLATVPLTYGIDPRLPFLLGAILLSVNFWMCFSLTVPHRAKKAAAELDEISFGGLVRALRVNRQWLLFFILGITGGGAVTIPHYRDVYLLALQVPVSWYGFIIAISSLIAAAMSYNLYRAERLKPETYYALSFITLFSITFISGFVKWQWLGILFMIAIMAYNRNEHLLAKTYLLKDCPTQELKATYLSLFSFMESLHASWMAVAIGALAGYFGVQLGFTYFGGAMLIVMSVLFLFYLRTRKRALQK